MTTPYFGNHVGLMLGVTVGSVFGILAPDPWGQFQ